MLNFKSNISRPRLLLMILGAVIFILFTPMVSFFFCFGSVVGMGIGIVIFLIGFFLDRIGAFLISNLKKGYFRILFAIFCLALCAIIIIAFIFVFNIMDSAFFSDGAPDNATVVVLGCQVRADSSPSKALRQRLDCAYDFLIRNEEAVCIVSGGKGPDEPIAEAQAMYDYLVNKGIDSGRIYIEDNSHDTNQNMKYSAEIIEENSLSREIAVITNSYHQYRASVYASHYGLSAYPVNSKTDVFAYPTNLVRELFAIVKMKIITA